MPTLISALFVTLALALTAGATIALASDLDDSKLDLHGDTPELHIIAVDKDGDLNYPSITQDGKAVTKWSHKSFVIKLVKILQEAHSDADDEADLSGSLQRASDPAALYLNKMMQNIVAKQRQLAAHKKGKKLQIVIHIHGGMNSITGAIQEAAHGYWVMENEDPTVYPIFICWNSEPLSCYWDHVCFDRNGYSLRNTDKEFIGFLTAPFYFLGDVGSGIARGPSGTIDQCINDFKTVSPQLYPESMDYVPMFEERKREIVEETKSGSAERYMHVEEGADNFDAGDAAWNATKYTATLPMKLVAGGVIAGLGPGAWSEMKRRVDLMFWKQEQLLPYCSPNGFNGPPNKQELDAAAQKNRSQIGGIAYFLRALKKQVLLNIPNEPKLNKTPIKLNTTALVAAITDYLQKSGQRDGSLISEEQYDVLKSKLAELCRQNSSLTNDDYDVILIGHSMGAIVINEMLENDPDIPYRKIVYMAAACPVKDFQDTIIPYLEEHTDCKFYNLCLNPEAELRNIELYEMAPRGGLLSWINDIFEGPADMRHRMYGQFITSINSSDLIPQQVRAQVYMKAFGFGTNPACGNPGDTHFQEGFPHNHGEFNSFGVPLLKENGNKQPVDFAGERPKTSNPHGFWTDDFIWYNEEATGNVNPLTFQPIKNPDLEPGFPVYTRAFDVPSWVHADWPCPSSSSKASQH